jgi:hypothetical protein
MAIPANNPNDQISMALPFPGQPAQSVTVAITAAEAFSITDPVDVTVLLFWKCIEAADQLATAESVWRHMADQGMREEGGKTIRQESVQTAVDRLISDGLIPQHGRAW